MINHRQTLAMQNINNQRGAALLTAMVFLTILTLIGITSMQNSRQEQKMSTNMQHLNHAFQYAESGLLQGINSIPSSINSVTAGEMTEQLLSTNPTPDVKLCSDPPDDLCTNGSNLGKSDIYIRYHGEGRPLGASLDEGFAYHYFAVTSNGITSDGTNNITNFVTETGISIIGPETPGAY